MDIVSFSLLSLLSPSLSLSLVFGFGLGKQRCRSRTLCFLEARGKVHASHSPSYARRLAYTMAHLLQVRFGESQTCKQRARRQSPPLQLFDQLVCMPFGWPHIRFSRCYFRACERIPCLPSCWRKLCLLEDDSKKLGFYGVQSGMEVSETMERCHLFVLRSARSPCSENALFRRHALLFGG